MKESTRIHLQWLFGLLSLPFVAIALLLASGLWLTSEANAIPRLEQYKADFLKDPELVALAQRTSPTLVSQLNEPDFGSRAYRGELSEFKLAAKEEAGEEDVARGFLAMPALLYSKRNFDALAGIFLIVLVPLLVLWLPFIFLAEGWKRLKNAGISLFLAAIPGAIIFTLLRDKLPSFAAAKLRELAASGEAQAAMPPSVPAFLENNIREALAPLAGFYLLALVVSVALIILGWYLPKVCV